MHIAHRAYPAHREATSHFEASKKELPLKTKTTTTDRTEGIKQMLSESGPESVLASKGRYSHTRTFATGRDQRAVLAFSPENKRVDGFVVNKDQQLVPIKPYDLPKELQQILTADVFETFLGDIQARMVQLSNGDFRLILQHGLKGGGLNTEGNPESNSEPQYIQQIKTQFDTHSSNSRGGRTESRIIIDNQYTHSLSLGHSGALDGYFYKQPSTEFKGGEILPKNAVGILLDSTRLSPCGTHGYVAVKIEISQEKKFTVICAFSTGFWLNNTAKIEIIPKSGAGLDPTGRVVNMRQLFSASDCHEGGGKEQSQQYKRISESCDDFEVSCEFTNEPKAYFIFTFKNRNIPAPALAPGNSVSALVMGTDTATIIKDLSDRLKQVETEQVNFRKMLEDNQKIIFDNQKAVIESNEKLGQLLSRFNNTLPQQGSK